MNAARLPSVAPEVTATLVEGLSPRLRKRLDAAVTQMAADSSYTSVAARLGCLRGVPR